MARGELLGKIEQLAEPVVVDLGFNLVDAIMVHEAGRWVLRLKIERQDAQGPVSTVTIEDCTRVSRALAAVLDVEAAIPMAYTLEVSSPGVDRRLRTPADFARFAGSLVEVRTVRPIEGRRTFPGRLQAMINDEVIVIVDTVEHRIPFPQIERAKIKYEAPTTDKKHKSSKQKERSHDR